LELEETSFKSITKTIPQSVASAVMKSNAIIHMDADSKTSVQAFHQSVCGTLQTDFVPTFRFNIDRHISRHTQPSPTVAVQRSNDIFPATRGINTDADEDSSSDDERQQSDSSLRFSFLSSRSIKPEKNEQQRIKGISLFRGGAQTSRVETLEITPRTFETAPAAETDRVFLDKERRRRGADLIRPLLGKNTGRSGTVLNADTASREICHNLHMHTKMRVPAHNDLGRLVVTNHGQGSGSDAAFSPPERRRRCRTQRLKEKASSTYDLKSQMQGQVMGGYEGCGYGSQKPVGPQTKFLPIMLGSLRSFGSCSSDT
jgi:hypothetical protein